MLTNADLWEAEIEQAVEALACNGDADSFAHDMRRLGFDDGEIRAWLSDLSNGVGK